MCMSFFVIIIGPDEKMTIKKRPKCHHNLKICIWHLAKFPQIINVLAVYLYLQFYNILYNVNGGGGWTRRPAGGPGLGRQDQLLLLHGLLDPLCRGELE